MKTVQHHQPSHKNSMVQKNNIPNTLVSNSINHNISNTIQCVKASNHDPKTYRSNILRGIAKSKGRLRHRRSRTAYGYFNNAGKRQRQGPHTISHVSTSVMIEALKQHGESLDFLVNSKLIPRPRIARKILKDGFSHSGKKLSPQRKIPYLNHYKRLHEKASGGDQRSIESLLELAPHQTYGWVKGSATSAEMAGKGERRNVAVDDLRRFAKMGKNDPIPSGSKTVDLSGVPLHHRGFVSDRARQMGKAAATDEVLSDAEDYGSDSDDDFNW